MNKKGASHIEIILSFLIFVGAVGFALYFFRPTDTSRLVETSTDYIYREINKNASLVVQTYSARINNGTIIDDEPKGKDKGKHNSILKIKFEKNEPLATKTYVETRNGTILNSTYDSTGNEVYLEMDSGDETNGWTLIDFIYIYFSDDFVEEKVSGGGALNKPEYYSIGSSYSENVISWNRALKLADNYQKSYDGLKEQFNIPGRVNFGFLLAVNSTMNITAQRQISRGFEVFTEEKRVKVLKDDRIIYGDLIVKVW